MLAPQEQGEVMRLAKGHLRFGVFGEKLNDIVTVENE